MKAAIQHFVIPLAVMAALWLIGHFAFGIAAELILGGMEGSRVFPFAAAHLLEEADEGIYRPLQDPAFITYTLCLGIFVFGASAYWAATRATARYVWFVATASIAALLLVALEYRFVLSPGYPDAMREAAFAALASFAVAAMIGLSVSVFLEARRLGSTNS